MVGVKFCVWHRWSKFDDYKKQNSVIQPMFANVGLSNNVSTLLGVSCTDNYNIVSVIVVRKNH